jgi:hypothetical protein
VTTIAYTHTVASAAALWDGFVGGTVRVAALVAGQPEETQRRIRAAFDRRAEEYRVPGGLELPVSVKLGAARKPGQTARTARPG